MDALNMYGREINKYIEQICSHSLIYLRDYTGMHGQQNIKLPTGCSVSSLVPKFILHHPLEFIYLSIDLLVRIHTSGHSKYRDS